MDSHTLATLEFGALLDLLLRHVQTPLGHKQVMGLRPLVDRTAIDRNLDLTSECVHFLNSGERFGLSGIEDPEPSLACLQVEATVLEPRQVLGLERLISVGIGLRHLCREPDRRAQYPGLAEITGRIPELNRLLVEIKGKVLPGGEIDDNASPALRGIRNEIQASRNRIHRFLEQVMRRQARAVQEEFITFRNGRFVIPVRTDSRIQVPGVVHGLSSSGQTTYMEPLAVIDQNNELVRLHEQEEAEIARILQAITEALRAHQHGLRALTEALSMLDLGQAKAQLAIEFDCVRPRLSRDCELQLTDARHILLDHRLHQSAGRAVPISFALDQGRQVMVISGPNAGGKTVVLKTVGLVALMAQTGLHVPAGGAVLPVFAQVFADIGDQQSIAANLSTFTAHMRNIAGMAASVSPPALLLIDEVGTGTDPEEGAALAIAIVDHFRRTGATTLASTHYNPLKTWAFQTPDVLNAAVEFDDKTLQPTYRLLVGIAGASSGLEIARRMGVPEQILSAARARENPDSTQASDYLKRLKNLVDEHQALRTALEDERAATAEKFASLEEEFAAREAGRRTEFEQALAHAAREFQSQSEKLIHGISDRIAAAKIRKMAQNHGAQLRRAGLEKTREIQEEIGLAAPPDNIPGTGAATAARGSVELKEGDRVWVRPLSQAGIVDSMHGDLCTVCIGSLKYRARMEELQFLESAARTESERMKPKPAPQLSLDRPFIPELKLIGMTADEALERVERFMDGAILSGAETVRIIHGHGKGILRRAVAEFLKGHPQVEKFQLAPPSQGGGGATVVELKK